MPSLPDGVGVGVQFNFSITFDQFVLYSHTETLAQPYLETTANPTLEHFQEKYVFDSGRTIRIAVSCEIVIKYTSAFHVYSTHTVDIVWYSSFIHNSMHGTMVSV